MASFGLGQGFGGNQTSPAEPVDSSTPWMAASEGDIALLQTSLTSLNLPLTAADENGYTLLHAAASYSKLDVVQFLIGNHVDVHARDKDGDTALHYAGTVEVAQLLTQNGKADPTQVNGQGKSALQAKREELEEMLQDEDVEDDDDDLEALKAVVQYLSGL